MQKKYALNGKDTLFYELDLSHMRNKISLEIQSSLQNQSSFFGVTPLNPSFFRGIDRSRVIRPIVQPINVVKINKPKNTDPNMKYVNNHKYYNDVYKKCFEHINYSNSKICQIPRNDLLVENRSKFRKLNQERDRAIEALTRCCNDLCAYRSQTFVRGKKKRRKEQSVERALNHLKSCEQKIYFSIEEDEKEKKRIKELGIRRERGKILAEKKRKEQQRFLTFFL